MIEKATELNYFKNVFFTAEWKIKLMFFFTAYAKFNFCHKTIAFHLQGEKDEKYLNLDRMFIF